MKKESKRFLGFLGVTIIVLSTIALGLGCYILCSACFKLYKLECMSEFAAMLIGAIIMAFIAFTIYVISVTWKELKETRKNN